MGQTATSAAVDPQGMVAIHHLVSLAAILYSTHPWLALLLV